jgi:hypothetical protein
VKVTAPVLLDQVLDGPSKLLAIPLYIGPSYRPTATLPPPTLMVPFLQPVMCRVTHTEFDSPHTNVISADFVPGYVPDQFLISCRSTSVLLFAQNLQSRKEKKCHSLNGISDN